MTAKKKKKNHHILCVKNSTKILIHHEQGASKDLSGVQEMVDVGFCVMLTTVAVAAFQDGGEVCRISMFK